MNVDQLRFQRAEFQQALAAALAVRDREAYLVTQGGDEAAYEAAKAEVERLQGGIAHLNAAEKGAVEAAEKERAADREQLRQERSAASSDAAGNAMTIAEVMDVQVSELAASFSKLVAAHEKYATATLGLIENEDHRQSAGFKLGRFEEVLTRRIAALLARKGLVLPAGQKVIREADVAPGNPGLLESVESAVADRLLDTRPELRSHPSLQKKYPRRAPEIISAPRFSLPDPKLFPPGGGNASHQTGKPKSHDRYAEAAE